VRVEKAEQIQDFSSYSMRSRFFLSTVIPLKVPMHGAWTLSDAHYTVQSDLVPSNFVEKKDLAGTFGGLFCSSVRKERRSHRSGSPGS
jgi:hypothetical protein